MSSLRSLSNEGTSSAENMQTHGPGVKSTIYFVLKQATQLSEWYTTLDILDVVEACPACRNICNCGACLKPGMANKKLPIPDLKLGTAEKIKHSHDIVRVLLPSLKKFVAEENMEREHEARFQGLPITGLHLVKSNLNNNDCILCDRCKSSVLDVHRSCLNCLFKLCVTCCLEIRQHDDGTIVCPPESLGGCGRQNLELMSRYSNNWVSELLIRAEAVANAGKVTDSPEAVGAACPGSSQGSEVENATLLAHHEDSNGNYLHCHCPTSLVVVKDDLNHFQWHLHRGEPVVVPDVVSGATGFSWEPMVMWRACRKPRNPDHLIKDFRVLNCSSLSKETISIHQFCNGYVKGLYDGEGRRKILKLEDWPPGESLHEQLPRHYLEFVRCLPFMLYTHPCAGHLNMSTRIPIVSRKLDMGPKMSITYGVGQELGSSSLTMIRCALSDRVDILMHTAAISLVPSTSTSKAAELKEPECVLAHPVHERAFYLTLADKRNLKEEYGVEPWTIVQKLGDAVFVPAGCPHQIRYLQSCTSVAFNFVAPESFGECIRLSAEYRRLPQNHRYKEDKLQVKQMTLQVFMQNDASRNHVKAPRVDSDVQETCIPLRDLMFMKQEMETKISTLQKQGHLVQPHIRAYMEKSIQNFLVRIDKEMQKNFVGTSSSS
ncbi:Transcription factor jumonji domain-containing protein [Perilla frutescens var. hirtella]|uniref:Transcription factor jumonji domain-containing protein n=1 Tax=Perilla frutescens var. hirtella TaxID=608512 RepID=A0AAD4P3J7_PERFH|nr:Transcription factor jumonji domain-containing protein [Perilla frutescens var. hirtella]